MRKLPVAIQVYSIREEAEKDFADVMKKVKAMGYDGVELAGLYGYSPEDIRDWLNEIGLVPISAHVPYEQLKNNLAATVADYALIGCKYIAIPYLSEEDRYGTDQYDAFLAYIPLIANECKKHNIVLLYHNHDFEFEKNVQGTYVLDHMYQQFASDILQTELDTGWVHAAGEDPIAYIHQYANRCPLIHVKDYSGKMPMETMPLGDGVLDVKGILDAAVQCGANWVVVEQDDHYLDTPMEETKKSILYLDKIGW